MTVEDGAGLRGVVAPTDEQTWIEAAARRVAALDSTATWDDLDENTRDDYRDDARALWPLVAPLVTAAEDAERRIQAVRDVCADNLGVTTASVLGALDREGTRR